MSELKKVRRIFKEPDVKGYMCEECKIPGSFSDIIELEDANKNKVFLCPSCCDRTIKNNK